MRYDNPRLKKDEIGYYIPSKTANNRYIPTKCIGCGIDCLISKYSPNREKVYCTNKCRGESERDEKSHNYKGGRIKTSHGYIAILNPNMIRRGRNSKERYILEHINIMQKHLGRKIEKGETVHHKNGLRDDNRLENLELWTGNHGKGQRVEDLVAHAKEILALYGHLVK